MSKRTADSDLSGAVVKKSKKSDHRPALFNKAMKKIPYDQLKPQQLVGYFQGLSTESLNNAKAMAYLCQLQSGFSLLQLRFLELPIHNLTESEIRLANPSTYTQLKPKAEVCVGAINGFGDIADGTKDKANQDTYILAVELRAVYLNVLISTHGPSSPGYADNNKPAFFLPNVEAMFELAITILETHYAPKEDDSTLVLPDVPSSSPKGGRKYAFAEALLEGVETGRVRAEFVALETS
jgi:hypothetical protein